MPTRDRSNGAALPPCRPDQAPMSNGQPFNDPEDMFADTRMSFGDHLEELRAHLWRAVYGFGFAMVLAIFVAYPVLRFISAPVEKQLDIFYQKRAERAVADARA